MVITQGTATLSDVEGYEVGGKTGTAQIVENGVYTNKINTFASVFPSSNPKYVLIVLRRYKTFKDYIYKYRNKTGSYKGTFQYGWLDLCRNNWKNYR